VTVSSIALSMGSGGIKDKAFKWKQIQEAFLDPKVYILCICGFCNGVGSGGLGYFGSALLLE
ncbi:hypothetical protein, partial [Serratia marcescens]|uniref:hypothetical protein n=1 Tax=Serratia marcescens TaxID=615 RepID=UPI0019530D10